MNKGTVGVVILHTEGQYILSDDITLPDAEDRIIPIPDDVFEAYIRFCCEAYWWSQCIKELRVRFPVVCEEKEVT